MTRRTFAASVAAFFAVPLSMITTRRTYGLMTLDRWEREGMRARGARVLLDGEDITDECTHFNDRERWAVILQRNAEGQHFLNDAKTGAACVRLRGRVEVVFQKRTRS